MVVRLAQCDLKGSQRLEGYLNEVFSELLAGCGFANEVNCDFRLKVSQKQQKNQEEQQDQKDQKNHVHSVSLTVYLHGNKNLNCAIHGHGTNVSVAIQDASRRLEQVLRKVHDRKKPTHNNKKARQEQDTHYFEEISLNFDETETTHRKAA